MPKSNRNIFNSFKTYQRYYRFTGLYSFILSNIVKILITILIIAVLAILINSYVIKVSEIPAFLIKNFPLPAILIFFLLSESFLGVIPPDIFILWVSEMKFPYLMVGLLGFISYVGGFNAYFIGSLIGKIPKIKNKVEKIYANHIDKINKWGSIFIVISALLPIPYAIVCSLVGMMKYPFYKLTYLGFFRIARFYLYAWAIFIIF
ncbi:MAG: hypothetical protein LBQ22_02810 [Bacteroidales bacterium]|jgi:hypothetical protein|nr:hypothetical protein [Bacteroidales bacterium]